MKRVVIRHASGMHQIVGTVDGQPDPYIGIDRGVLVNNTPVALRIVVLTPRYCVYAIVLDEMCVDAVPK